MTLRAKLRIAFLALLFAAALLPAWTTLRMWFAYGGDMLLRVDYSLYVASAQQGLQAGWHKLYDLEAQRRLWETLPSGLWWFPNVYTPALSVVMIPFTHLSLDAGYTIWRLFLLACILVSWRLLAPGDWAARIAQLPMLLIPYPVQLGLWMGQVIALEMAVVALVFVALRHGRDKTAGALLSVMALKPQGLLLVPFALLAAGRRKAFAAWVVSMAVIGIGVLALIGFDGAFAYLERLGYARAHLTDFWVAWSYTLARRFDSAAALRVVQLLIAALTLFASYRHRERPEIALAAGLIASMLASPFLHLDDYMMLIPAMWLVLRVHPTLPFIGAALVGYGTMLLTANNQIGGRWMLMFTCISLPVLAAMPPAAAKDLREAAPPRYA